MGEQAREHREWMRLALREARAALETGDVPVGAVVIDASGVVVGHGRNDREARQDPTGHAEVLAITDQGQALRSLHPLAGLVEPKLRYRIIRELPLR